MESSHIGFNLEDLRVEQESIDKLIDSLLSFNATASSSSSLNRGESEILSSPAQVRGKGPGRPKGTRNTSTRTPSSPSPSPAENTSLSTVIQCLNKLNVQNKRLLDIVEKVSESVKKIIPSTPESSEDGTEIAEQKQSLDSVSDRLEKIEQNININTLVCRGAAVDDLIKTSSTRESPNLERLKGEICRIACGDDVTGIDITNMRVSVFGREKKCVKINCANSTSKLHLLKSTRTRKPDGFYISEFLTPAKLKVFYNLRNLKKQHPGKIKSVFTRGGNILYTTHNSDRVHQVSSLNDLHNIIRPDSSESASTSE